MPEWVTLTQCETFTKITVRGDAIAAFWQAKNGYGQPLTRVKIAEADWSVRETPDEIRQLLGIRP